MREFGGYSAYRAAPLIKVQEQRLVWTAELRADEILRKKAEPQ